MYWSLAGKQLKLGSVPNHCVCFAEGKYLARCDVVLGGGQLQNLSRCHFRLRLHSHMTSLLHAGAAQVDIMVWKKFHVTSMQRLSHAWSAGAYGR